jgi:TatD DNase family protein
VLVDTHCHLTDGRYADDLPDTLKRAKVGGVGAVIAVASDLDDAARVRGLLHDGPGVPGSRPLLFGTAGVHPHQSSAAPEGLRERLLDALRGDSRVVAVGECGLDYHYDFSPKDRQRKVFDLQIDVAREAGLPLVVHCREAEADMAGAVRDAGSAGVRGVLHCFPGDLNLLETALEAGWMVSFTGIVTFPSFQGHEAVRTVPRDRYMLETDGPYLAPVPHRGKRNEPALVGVVRDRVAEIRGEASALVEADALETARRFFGLELGEADLHGEGRLGGPG